MKLFNRSHNHQNGFTLIEVMLVIVLIGVMAGALQFNIGKGKHEELLESASKRFAALFYVASEYALLNNIEMAIYFKDNTYQFVGYDGERWSPLENDQIFSDTSLHEDIALTLELEDLPIEEPQLFDSNALIPEEEDLFESDGLFTEGEDAEKKKPIIPQLYILSGGDFTPFSLTFSIAELTEYDKDVSFKVSGIFDPRVTVEGPFFDEN